MYPGRFYFRHGAPAPRSRCAPDRVRSRGVRLFILALALAACSSPAQPGAPEPRVADPPTGAPPDPCAQVIADYDRILSEAPVRCASDSDCACYSGGVSDRKGCGGVDHRDKAGRLDAARERFRAAGCRATIHCAAWMCQPVCDNGSCVNRE